MMLVFHFVSTGESVNGKGDAEEKERMLRSMGGWEDDFAVFAYTPVFYRELVS